jgi:hypothetical protein
MKHVPLGALLAALAAGCAVPHPPTRMQFDAIGPPTPAERAVAQEPQAATPGQARTVPIGIGYTDDPDTMLLAAAIDFPMGDNWTVGPALQLGVDDDFTIVAPVFQAKRFFPITSGDEGLRRLLPFVQGGAGVAWFQRDNTPGDDDEVGLLLQVGGGVRFKMTDELSLGTQMDFNFLPSDPLDESFYFSWEVLQFVFHW